MPTPRALNPNNQKEYAGLARLDPHVLHERRERMFLVLAGFFVGTLAMLNILGVTRFVGWTVPIPGWVPLFEGTFPLFVAVGVLPYPLTFLCTDFISELYGRRRANWVVFVGLLINVWVLFILWLGGVLPPAPSPTLAALDEAGERLPLFYEIRRLTFGATLASMLAYLAAQLTDVHVFHFWKRVTKGRMLWVRNNGSTMVSQIVDTTAVILITHYYARALPIDEAQAVAPQLLAFIISGYAFKFIVAAVDTPLFYAGTHHLSRYLRLDPFEEHDRDAEVAGVRSKEAE